MKILHIANWYPSKPYPSKALWIKHQIDSLPINTKSTIYHIETLKNKFRIFYGRNEDRSYYIILHLPFEIWRIFEWISLLLVLLVLRIEHKNKYDIINFHIAYPNCTYIKLLKRIIKRPIVISEHWSAYHFYFNIKNPKKTRRIRNIFSHNVPVISVSNALADDIKNFSGACFPLYIIPNVVDTETFNYNPFIPEKERKFFFMVSQWRWPKNPFIVLKAWSQFANKSSHVKLRIGGYGSQWVEMKKLASKLNLDNHVEFLGYLKPLEIAEEMNNALALIHCSEYETFSVVCAESVCCGTPVIASDVGGIRDFISDKNGLLISNFESRIIEAVDFMIENKKLYDNKIISQNAIQIFNSKNIGNQYFNVVQDIMRK